MINFVSYLAIVRFSMSDLLKVLNNFSNYFILETDYNKLRHNFDHMSLLSSIKCSKWMLDYFI